MMGYSTFESQNSMHYHSALYILAFTFTFTYNKQINHKQYRFAMYVNSAYVLGVVCAIRRKPEPHGLETSGK